ncbi:hypothetical protein Tco_0608940 [Tanacetum coccineum]
MEVDENDEENGGNDDEDDAEESEFSPHVVLIIDGNDEPVPPIIQFDGNFQVRESSSTRALLASNSWVRTHGLMGCNLGSVQSEEIG